MGQGSQGAQGAMGLTGSAGPPGAAGSAGGLNGRKEFFVSVNPVMFVVPDGVTRLSVELYGAGGGGGIVFNGNCLLGGGGGGGGAYTNAILTVQPGQTLQIMVGAHGTGGPGATNGGDTQVLDVSNNVLVVAHGGNAAPDGPNFGCSSPVGSGGAPDSTAAISHAGLPGGAGSSLAVNPNPNGPGGKGFSPPGFQVSANGIFGEGGDGTLTVGNAGGDGYAVISW